MSQGSTSFYSTFGNFNPVLSTMAKHVHKHLACRWFRILYMIQYLAHCGRRNVFRIAIRYALDGPEIDSRWGELFHADGPKAHAASCKIGTGSIWRLKRPRRSVDHTPASSAVGANGLELYFRLSSVSSKGMSWGDLYLYFAGCHRNFLFLSFQVHRYSKIKPPAHQIYQP
jgi:hypothetical protein